MNSDLIFKNTLVVLPARGGSKRIKKKNIKLIHGQPMIYWPLTEVKKLFNSENILVSTDCDEIKLTVERKGLNVPFKRPKNISDDFTGTAEVVTHALNWYESNIKKMDFVLTVYPTAVMISENDINKAMELLLSDSKCDMVMSATNFPFPIQRAVFEDRNGYAKMIEPKNFHKRSQDLLEARHDAGQFYITRAKVTREGLKFTETNVRLYLIQRNKVVDIDTNEDFKIAEELLKLHKIK